MGDMFKMEVLKKIDTTKLSRMIKLAEESIPQATAYMEAQIKSDAPHAKIKNTMRSRIERGMNFIAGMITTEAWWWRFFEYGTKAHEVVVKDRQILSDGSTFFGSSVTIPAMPPKSFVRKNKEEHRHVVMNMFKAVIKRVWGN